MIWLLLQDHYQAHEMYHLLTHSLHGAECSLRTYQFSASQEISRILCNPKVHYRVYKCPPPVPILSQINPVHARHPTS